MLEELRKKLDQGLDYAFMNAEKVAQAAKDFAKENKLNKEEAKKLYDMLLAKSEEARKTVEHELASLVKATLKKMEVPTNEEMKKLQARVAKLEAAGKKPVKAKAATKEPVAKKAPAKKVKPE